MSSSNHDYHYDTLYHIFMETHLLFIEINISRNPLSHDTDNDDDDDDNNNNDKSSIIITMHISSLVNLRCFNFHSEEIYFSFERYRENPST